MKTTTKAFLSLKSAAEREWRWMSLRVKSAMAAPGEGAAGKLFLGSPDMRGEVNTARTRRAGLNFPMATLSRKRKTRLEIPTRSAKVSGVILRVRDRFGSQTDARLIYPTWLALMTTDFPRRLAS